VGQIEAGIDGGATRSGQGAHVIVNDRIGVEGQPLLYPGKPPCRVEVGTPEAGVISALYLRRIDIA
jgi:hypothetical protein